MVIFDEKSGRQIVIPDVKEEEEEGMWDHFLTNINVKGNLWKNIEGKLVRSTGNSSTTKSNRLAYHACLSSVYCLSHNKNKTG